jgi:hypothetical protein
MSFLNSKFSNIEISILEIGRRNASLDDPEGRRVILLVIFSLLSLPIMLGVSVSEYFNSHYFLSAALIVGVIVLLINIVVNLSRGFTLWSVRGVTAYFRQYNQHLALSAYVAPGILLFSGSQGRRCLEHITFVEQWIDCSIS